MTHFPSSSRGRSVSCPAVPAPSKNKLYGSHSLNSPQGHHKTACSAFSKALGTLEVYKTPQEEGAPQVLSRKGLSPFEVVLLSGSEKCAFSLVAQGAKLPENSTVLHEAYAADCVSFSLMKAVLDISVIDLQDLGGNTLLHLACEKGDFEVVLFLLQKGANPHIPNERGCTPLFAACGVGSSLSVEALLEYGARADARDNILGTPLHVVCLHPFHDNTLVIAKLLLKCGAPIDAQLVQVQEGLPPVLGETPLMFACYGGNNLLVALLVENNANPNLGIRDEVTPLSVACVLRKDIKMVQLLLNSPIKPYIDKTSYGHAPLHIACVLGDIEMAQMLLEARGNVNVRAQNHNTPLHYAFMVRNEKLISLLLAHGADLLAQDKNGKTPEERVIQRPALQSERF